MFDLHQATQHTCMALLWIYTGYRSTTHNLSRLLAIIENFSFVPSTIFPCITEEETALFNILNKAYSDARYNENSKVPINKAPILTDRVKELLTISEQLYQIKINDLENNHTITFPLVIENESSASA